MHCISVNIHRLTENLQHAWFLFPHNFRLRIHQCEVHILDSCHEYQVVFDILCVRFLGFQYVGWSEHKFFIHFQWGRMIISKKVYIVKSFADLNRNCYQIKYLLDFII